MAICFKTIPQKILIIKPSSLGDIVHTLPFLAAVHKQFPGAEIHWVVARGLHSILDKHPLISKLWIIDKDRWKSIKRIGATFSEVCSLIRGLRAEKFDLSVDLSGLLRSGLITFFAGAQVRLGFKDGDEGSPFFYSHKIESGIKDNNHAIDRNLKLAAYLECNTDEIEYPMAPFDPEPEVLKGLPEKYAVIAPSAGKEANRWPAERFGELAAQLPLPSVIISSPADKSLVDKVVACSNGRAVSLAGKTSLTELFTLLGKASFFISNDTGPMHIAAAMQTPVFAIFGPANPQRTGPYGDIHTVIQENLACSPCYAWQPCDNWQCMENITVERVLAIINKSSAKK